MFFASAVSVICAVSHLQNFSHFFEAVLHTYSVFLRYWDCCKIICMPDSVALWYITTLIMSKTCFPSSIRQRSNPLFCLLQCRWKCAYINFLSNWRKIACSGAIMTWYETVFLSWELWTVFMKPGTEENQVHWHPSSPEKQFLAEASHEISRDAVGGLSSPTGVCVMGARGAHCSSTLLIEKAVHS